MSEPDIRPYQLAVPGQAMLISPRRLRRTGGPTTMSTTTGISAPTRAYFEIAVRLLG